MSGLATLTPCGCNMSSQSQPQAGTFVKRPPLPLSSLTHRATPRLPFRQSKAIKNTLPQKEKQMVDFRPDLGGNPYIFHLPITSSSLMFAFNLTSMPVRLNPHTKSSFIQEYNQSCSCALLVRSSVLQKDCCMMQT